MENHEAIMSDDYLNPETDIAIIGMACRFPDADNPEEYWNNLRSGHESRTDLTDEELKSAGLSQDLLDNPNYVKAGMFLKGVENFDAGFFGFSPLDAKIMDPQHRHFLECSWEAFENAGYNPENISGAVGVFAGSGQNGYLPYNVQTNPELEDEVGFFLLRHTGNDKDFLTTRASYLFNLKGPSINVQTACSTSLVAIHTAVQSLLNGESDMALAAGVTIELNKFGYLYKASEILSSDGHCRPFEADSDGTVFGSGVGVVILKRLEDAQRDGDTIHAIIKSSAINNDGAGKVSYLAPSVDGHAAAAREALEIGAIDPDTVTYIECHGTGTLLGDPIEVAALSQAYGTALDTEAPIAAKQFCGIGSVKSNIGHTDTAAGVASLLKVVGCLKNRQLVPTLHFNKANPSIDFANSPFYVNAELKDWRAQNILRAGVSSLGVGGTNAHIILQEAPGQSPSAESPRQQQLILLSARSEKSLQKTKVKYIDFLSDHSNLNIADAAYTLTLGRKHFEKRLFVVADSVQSALQQLEGGNNESEIGIASAPREAREVAFMFAGGGAQYPNMGRHLYESEPVYRETIDACLQYLQEFIDYDLKALLYPSGTDTDSIKAAAKELRRPSRSLPALLTTQYAQAKLWQSWGVNPEAMIGHSMGENTAACLSGVLSLKDALGLVALRGQLFETLEEGGMLSVSLDEQDLRPRLGDTLDIAAINAPGLAVASGPVAELDKLQAELEKEEISCQRIHINVAAHSRMLASMLKPFGDYLRSITLNAPAIPFLSNLSGTWITDEEATDPEYWVNHLRHTVRFADGVETLLKADKYVLLEVGPGKTLSTLAGMHGAKKAADTIQPSMRHPDDDKPDLDFMLTSMGIVWQGNGDIDWQTFYRDQQRHRIPLPTYSFDHARHWVEANKTIAPGGGTLPRFEKPEEWCYQPVWQQSSLPIAQTTASIANQTVVLLGDDRTLTQRLQETLLNAGCAVIRVTSGRSFSRSGDQQFGLRFNNPDDYIHLVSDLLNRDSKPTVFIHTLAGEIDSQLNVNTAKSQRYKVFDSLLYLAQALGGEDLEHTIRLVVLTQQMQQLAGEELQNPLQSLVLGPCRVIPNENPMIHTCALDIAENHLENAAFYQRCIHHLFPETSAREATVALRGASSFQLQLNRQPASASNSTSLIKPEGVYLVTGGLGGLGMIAAQALAEKQKVTIALMSRHVLPERDYWPQLKQEGGGEAEKIAIIEQLEAAGSRVLIVKGDVGKQADLQRVKQTIESEAGPINGIIHTAGVIRDGIIQLKETSDVDAVMAPKVLGTLALVETFNPAQLDFLLLYSSTSAFTGLAGQVDYTAANAFLDCLAHYYSGKGINTVTSINWPAWKTIGMAANSAKAVPVGKIGGRPVAHPFLGRLEEGDNEKLYTTQFSVDKFWLLKEHRIKNGGCLIPGSGYIELARAALADTEAKPVVIEKAQFLYPFFVGDQETKSLQVRLTAKEGGYQFVASSGDDEEAIEHTTGTIRIDESITNALAKETADIAALQQQCNAREQLYTDPDHHPFLDFGSHWECLEKVHVGDKQALIDLSLKPEYADELEQLRLHPALLDLATAGAQVLIDGYDPYAELYVPIGYGKLEFAGSMPQKVYSHVTFVRHTHAKEAGNDTVNFTVSMYDENGKLFCRITDFTMQRVHDVAAITQQVASGEHEVDPTLQKVLDLGIAPAEGKAVIENLLSSNLLPEVAVSVFDINGLFEELRKLSAPPEADVDEGPAHDADADPDIPVLEAKLLEHPALKQVFVRSHLDEDGSRRFIAHFVVDDMASATVSELRKYARQHLDAEMVPQHFVELYQVPTNEKGEVDRTQMLDPFAPESKYVAPRTSTEKQLAKIWQDLLGVDKVGLRDNFFDIGGHSLVSIRVIVRAEKKLGVRLDQAKMVLLTLEQLAADIDGEKPNLETVTDESAESISSKKSDGSKQSSKFLRSIFGQK